MEGNVSHFLPSKGFGFIQGDDGRNYFAHQSDFGDRVPVDGQRVRFAEDVTPKGYRARHIEPIADTATDLFVVPDGILQTREAEIRDWELIEASPWRIHSSSRESPDEARAGLLARASLLGATGVVLVSYYKTRGSEAGTGKGVHHYTIHNFHAHPVVVARRHAAGVRRRAELEGLSARIRTLKSSLVESSRRSRALASRVGIAAFAAVVLLGAVLILGFLGAVTLFSLLATIIMASAVAAGAFALIRKDHDGWLQEP
jgi:cold shock CspA family protein